MLRFGTLPLHKKIRRTNGSHLFIALAEQREGTYKLMKQICYYYYEGSLYELSALQIKYPQAWNSFPLEVKYLNKVE